MAVPVRALRRFLLLLAALLPLVLVVTLPALAEERVLRFESSVRVEADGALAVTEDIAVAAEGGQIRRGIFRDFPTRYADRHGRQVRVGFEVVRVERDGRPEPYALEPLANGTRVRVGDPDVLLPHGPHRYTIAYRTTRQLGLFADFDELYWNVTGNGWPFRIDEALAVIELPPGAAVLRHALYTGYAGEQGGDARLLETSPGGGRIAFATTRPLEPGEGLTVAVAWPKGHVAAPSSARQAAWLLGDNAHLLAAGGGTVLVLAYYLLAWARIGRDPARGTVVPLFAPPAGLSAPSARFLTRMGYDSRAFAAGVLTLAVKGRLRIVDDGKRGGYRLERPGDARAGVALLPAEEALDRVLLGGGALVLHRDNHARVGRAMKALEAALEREHAGSFRANRLHLLAGLALSALTLGGALLLARDRVGEAAYGLGLVAAGGGGGAAALVLATARSWWAERGWRHLLLLAARILLLVPVAGGAFLLFVTGRHLELALGLIAILLVVAAFLFAHLLKAPTAAGRRLLDQLAGFRQYLAVAEEHRLGLLHPPERTPELFERYLPYALALGVEQTWSEKFAEVLRRSADAPDAARPSWYDGDDWNPGRPGRFADRVGSGLATAAAASSGTPPGSGSGSGGSGSSGGGGGGGGGGGW